MNFLLRSDFTCLRSLWRAHEDGEKVLLNVAGQKNNYDCFTGDCATSQQFLGVHFPRAHQTVAS